VQGIVETAQARIAAIDALQAAYEDRSAERAVLMAVVAAALSTPPAPRTPAEPVGVRDLAEAAAALSTPPAPRTPAEPVGVRDLAEVVRSSQKPGK
jgi:hypothetical protein